MYQNSKVQVYAVIGGWDYEGEAFHSLRLFDCKSSANIYREYLTQHDGYDYAKMEVKEICMISSIRAPESASVV